MCRIASLFLLQMLKGTMSSEARNFNNIGMRHDMKFFFFRQGKAAKEFHTIPKETLRGINHYIPPSKPGWPSLNVVIFRNALRFDQDDPKQ